MKTDFAETLSSLRHERGISQKKAAKDLQISQALLSHYENGVREPKFEFIHKACLYYGVSADYILGRLKTDAITVSCGSPYMMDMVNDVSQLVDDAEKLSDEAVAAVSAYVKSVIAGVEHAMEEPNHPANFEETANQQQLLAELYKALRKNN
ncbi:MAG: helix-turn-helix transcriptional regulator [Oscillospiraceae bacterium]|nr:helix-turn-helix transcriptional regulator [Oscillospiraceae bacterium]